MQVIQADRQPDRKSTRLNSSHTVIYTLSLHDALPILKDKVNNAVSGNSSSSSSNQGESPDINAGNSSGSPTRSEEHTSELQSHSDLHSFPTRRSSDLKRQSKQCC